MRSSVLSVAVVLGGCLAAFGCGDSPTSPSRDPGDRIHGEIASINVFQGNCVGDLANCSGEIPSAGGRYIAPPGSVATLRVCVNHPRLATRDLYARLPDVGFGGGTVVAVTAAPQLGYRENVTPSPICVGVVVRPPACFGRTENGVTRGLRVFFEEYRWEKVEDPLWESGTLDIDIATPTSRQCAF